MNPAQKYIEDVIAGRELVGETTRQAVERHLKWYENRPEYYFDEKAAQKILDAFDVIPHAKGEYAGKKFLLQPFQAFLLWVVYGWKKRHNDTRVIRKVYKKIARKGGKTELLAALGNIGLTVDSVPDAEIFWAATKKDQAKIGWYRQRRMMNILIKKSKFIADRWDTNTTSIFSKEDDTFCHYLGKDSHTEDGLSPYYGIIDEYHAHPDGQMVNVLESGTGTWSNPLIWIITTAGFNINGPCHKFEGTCKNILKGVLRNDNIFPLIFDIDDGDEWQDREIWKKANPQIGITPTWDYMLAAHLNAKTEGAEKEIDFKTKNLNIWTSTHSAWIPDNIWTQCGTDWNLNDLDGKVCYAGLDASATQDTTSLCLLFPLTGAEVIEKERFKVFWYFWIPDDTLESRSKDSASFRDWVNAKWIKTCTGNFVDLTEVENKIREVNKRFRLVKIGADKWNTIQMGGNLTSAGIDFVIVQQVLSELSPPTKEAGRAIKELRLDHGNNPVSRWQVGNVALYMHHDDNIRIDKKKSTERVDGMAALVNAFAMYMDDVINGRVIYNERGIITI